MKHNDRFEIYNHESSNEVPKYILPSCQLQLPYQAIEQTLKIFNPYINKKLEACCFWYGSRDEAGSGIVQAIVIPQQHNTRGNYHVTSEAMLNISKNTRQYDLKNLAQIHTHPGWFVRHSTYDDANANSSKALSLVFPNYGAWTDVWPNGVGIHESQHGIWYKLDNTDVEQRIVFISTTQPIKILDMRRSS